jgi:hypothetical protein
MAGDGGVTLKPRGLVGQWPDLRGPNDLLTVVGADTL